MTIGFRRLLVPVAVVGLLVGCGTDAGGGAGGRSGEPSVKGVGLVRAGSTAQFADCADWRRGTVAQRRATIVSIRDQLTPQRSETAVSALTDDAAYELFAKVCTSGIGTTLRLYKIYAHAQAFAPLAKAVHDADD